MKSFARLAGVILLLVAVFVCWYTVAADYSDAVVSGTYRFAQRGETSMLVLSPDHTFYQDLNRSGLVTHAAGTWRRIGEGGITFSKEFLLLSGQEPGADGTTFVDMEKKFGILVYLRLRQYVIVEYGKTDHSATDTVSGTYHGDEAGVPAILVINADHTFEQTVDGRAKSAHAKGTWSNSPNGDVVFSREFLKASGEGLSTNETATALNPRGSDLQIEIAIHSSPAPTFRKKQFPWQ